MDSASEPRDVALASEAPKRVSKRSRRASRRIGTASNSSITEAADANVLVSGAGTTDFNGIYVLASPYTKGYLLTYWKEGREESFGLHCTIAFEGSPAGWYLTTSQNAGAYYNPSTNVTTPPLSGWTVCTGEDSDPGLDPAPELQFPKPKGQAANLEVKLGDELVKEKPKESTPAPKENTSRKANLEVKFGDELVKEKPKESTPAPKENKSQKPIHAEENDAESGEDDDEECEEENEVGGGEENVKFNRKSTVEKQERAAELQKSEWAERLLGLNSELDSYRWWAKKCPLCCKKRNPVEKDIGVALRIDELFELSPGEKINLLQTHFEYTSKLRGGIRLHRKAIRLDIAYGVAAALVPILIPFAETYKTQPLGTYISICAVFCSLMTTVVYVYQRASKTKEISTLTMEEAKETECELAYFLSLAGPYEFVAMRDYEATLGFSDLQDQEEYMQCSHQRYAYTMFCRSYQEIRKKAFSGMANVLSSSSQTNDDPSRSAAQQSSKRSGGAE